MASWPVTPMSAAPRPPRATTSRPATRALPPSGWVSVVSIRTAVVLPAPLGPSTPRIVPGRDAQVDAGEGDGRAEALGQALGLDHQGASWTVSLPVG